MTRLTMLLVGLALGACGGDDDDDSIGPGQDSGPGIDGGGDPDGSLADCTECITLGGGLVFDGADARPGAVVMRGATIEAVEYGDAPEIAGTYVDVTGATILPGLIDGHVHSRVSPGPYGWSPDASLFSTQVRSTLRAGVTSYLDVGAPPADVFSIRDSIEEGQFVGPRIFAVGPMFTPTGGHPCYGDVLPDCAIVDSPGDVEAAMAALTPDGPDFIKLILEEGWAVVVPSMTFDTAAAIVDAAEAAGLRPIAHVTALAEMQSAIDAGVRILSHLPYQEVMSEQDIQILTDNDVTLTPTLSFMDGLYRIGEDQLTELDDPSLADDVDGDVITALQDPGLTAEMRDDTSRGYNAMGRDNMLANLMACYEAGVTIVAGTDAGNPGVFHGRALHREMVLYVEAGMAPADAILTATRNAADLLARPDLGRIEAGAIADLLLLDGNPLEDMEAAFGAIHSVYKEGELVDRDALAVFH